MLNEVFGIAGQKAFIIGTTPIADATHAIFSKVGAIVEMTSGTSEEAEMASAFSGFIKRNGGLDILVFASTRIGTYSLPEMSPDQWDTMQNANLRAAFLAFREAIRWMKDNGGGRIVAVSTMGSVHPVLKGNAAYGSSKAGLNALVRSAALDHAGDGIRVNAVLHGAVAAGAPPADAVQLGGPATQPNRLLLGMGTTDDVASAILYMCSPAASFITGQTLALDGGFLIN